MFLQTRTHSIARLRNVQLTSLRRARTLVKPRPPQTEQLEARWLLSIANLPGDLKALGNTLDMAVANAPVTSQANFDQFDLLFKQQYTEVVIKPTIDFLNQHNPVPACISNFLTAPVLNIPVLSTLLTHVGISTTPKDILTTFAAVNGHSDVEDAFNGLNLFFSLNTLQNDVNNTLTAPSTNISDYDSLFTKINSFGIPLPLVQAFDTAKASDSGNPGQLATDAQELASTLATGQGNGPFGTTELSFSSSGS